MIHLMQLAHARPGLARCLDAPFVQRRLIEAIIAPSYSWRNILEQADIVSEGRTHQDGADLVYYGSTSLLIRQAFRQCGSNALSILELVRVVDRDPHIRLRVLRLAHREAAHRAQAPLGPLRAEVRVGATHEGILISVDMNARIVTNQTTASSM